MIFTIGSQFRYVLGRTRSGKDIEALHPVTLLEVRGERALVRNSPNELTDPEGEREVWLSRLR